MNVLDLIADPRVTPEMAREAALALSEAEASALL